MIGTVQAEWKTPTATRRATTAPTPAWTCYRNRYDVMGDDAKDEAGASEGKIGGSGPLGTRLGAVIGQPITQVSPHGGEKSAVEHPACGGLLP